MSTRSVVASGDVKKWEGVYAHLDGYPTARGPILWKLLKESPSAGVFVRDNIYAHAGGWSSFGKQCYCHDPQFLARDGFNSMLQTNDSCDPLFIEWAYIVDAEAGKLHILECYDTGKKFKKDYGNGKVHMAQKYAHRLVESVDLDGPEPNWDAIEKKNQEE